MKTTFLLATAIVLSFGINTANAQARCHFNQQHAQIRQGIRSGELTKREARNLVSDQRNIHREIRSAKSDGVVTPIERKDIRQDRNQAGREIYRKKHNDRDRG
jgi:hypothetical protein